MKIFKFGGASVKDADGVKNVTNLLKTVGFEDTLLVISAMGKTTNALEEVISSYIHKKPDLDQHIKQVIDYHQEIMLKLFDTAAHPVFQNTQALFSEMEQFLERNTSQEYNFVYDQVIGYGELVSTKIVSEYLNYVGIQNTWIDVRTMIKTNESYRDASVEWYATQAAVTGIVKRSVLNITQGFLGRNFDGYTTTLGREGSDYTAAIMGYCLDAESVTIWKDVPGVLNADPRYFQNAILLNKISYREAIELAFYGASVIHPKTLQPLQQKEIPLFVKSFIDPKAAGTKVAKGSALEPETPCFIVKNKQVLLSLSSLDFSFIMEEGIGQIFKCLGKYGAKVDMIQNSAISFSVCIDDKFGAIEDIVSELRNNFKIEYQKGVSLYTIRHGKDEDVNRIEGLGKVLLKQKFYDTVQVVTAAP